MIEVGGVYTYEEPFIYAHHVLYFLVKTDAFSILVYYVVHIYSYICACLPSNVL